MTISIKRLEKISRTYQHFRRFEEIVKIIFKYGLQDVLQGFNLPSPLDAAIGKLLQQDDEITQQPLPRRIRMACQELGPTYIKLGQILSMRMEMLSPDIIEELTQLQDRVPPFAYEDVSCMIRSELGRPVGELFPRFEKEPVGSASLGQVHRARLPDGQHVVVKVQRPDIRSRIAIDLEILMHLADFAEKNIEEFRYRRPTRFLEEFAHALEVELDYKQEEAHILRFREIFRYDDHVHMPKPFPTLSTEKILTMEYIDGISARDLTTLDRQGYDRKQIADRGVDCILKQIFEEGFFHADPHPGNIFVLPDNDVSFVDCGMVGRLTRRHREQMADFLLAVSQKDNIQAVRLLVKMSDCAEKPDTRRLERQMGEIIDRYVNKSLKNVSFAQLFARLSQLLADNRMVFSPDFSMMLKTIATLEGVGRSLNPNLDLTAKLKPYFTRLRLERFRPSHMFEDAGISAGQMLDMFREIPEQLHEALQQMLNGNAELKVEHRGSDSFHKFWSRLANRLSFALIVAALLVASSIMVQSGIPPKWHDIPVIGLLGFIIAGVMSLKLLISIWRNGMF